MDVSEVDRRVEGSSVGGPWFGPGVWTWAKLLKRSMSSSPWEESTRMLECIALERGDMRSSESCSTGSVGEDSGATSSGGGGDGVRASRSG